ncbi:MAG: toluene tolerance protein [Alphaproteobacteria bacterium]|nr:toluene tolerance protein [Alphaproteobacteria bacterium]
MRLAAILSLIIALFIAAPVQAAGEEQQAGAFVDNVLSQAIGTIKQTRSGQLSQNNAKVKFRQILNNAFDVPTIARFTLGRYWRVATPDQRAEHARLIKTAILDKYADRVLSYSGSGYKIDKSAAINERDYAVTALIDREQGAPVNFGWRLRKTGNSFKVIDLSVEGISMSVTHQSDFASIIERNGGRVESLLAALRNKDLPAH